MKILKGQRSTIRSNVLHLNRLNLDDKIGIFSVTGGSYSTTEKETYYPYKKANSKRNNVTISFVLADEDTANAELIIDEPMTFALGTIIHSENNSIRSIEKGSFTIKAKNERLNDNIPPLGKSNGTVFKSFKFNDIDVTDPKLNGLKFARGSTADIDITYDGIAEKFKEQGNVILIKIIETAIIKDGEYILASPE